MGLEILRPWRSVEKISICPVHTGMNPASPTFKIAFKNLSRTHGDESGQHYVVGTSKTSAPRKRGYTRFGEWRDELQDQRKI